MKPPLPRKTQPRLTPAMRALCVGSKPLAVSRHVAKCIRAHFRYHGHITIVQRKRADGLVDVWRFN